MAVPEVAVLFFMPRGTVIAAPAFGEVFIRCDLYNAFIPVKPADIDPALPPGITGQRIGQILAWGKCQPQDRF